LIYIYICPISLCAAKKYIAWVLRDAHPEEFRELVLSEVGPRPYQPRLRLRRVVTPAGDGFVAMVRWRGVGG
jgi:hypothetical protein